jgi:hypothetical protein
MRPDYLIAVLLAAASSMCSNAMSAAADYFPWLHAHPAVNFYLSIGLTTILVITAVLVALRGERKESAAVGPVIPLVVFRTAVAIYALASIFAVGSFCTASTVRTPSVHFSWRRTNSSVSRRTPRANLTTDISSDSNQRRRGLDRGIEIPVNLAPSPDRTSCSGLRIAEMFDGSVRETNG